MVGILWLVSIVGAVIVADQKNLGIVGSFLLALFLGPVGFVIILLLSPRPKMIKSSASHPSLPTSPRQEIVDIKKTLTALQERVEFLERQLAQDHDTVEHDVVVHTTLEPAPVDTSDGQFVRPEGMEFVFGKYWLPKIGIVLFVMGIGLFISYSFHYFSPFLKIAIGYFFAVAFLVWGERLEKNPLLRRLSWAILGGAWGLFYLTTYAMHYIPATKIIINPSIELFLLWVVSVLCVKYSLKYQSWMATAFSFFFGFMTMGIGALDLSSVIFWTILVGGTAYVAYAFGWYELLMAGLWGSYAMFLFVLAPKLMGWSGRLFEDSVNFRIGFALLTTTWAIFLLTAIGQKLKNKLSTTPLITTILTNTSLYAILGLWQISQLSYDQGFSRKFSFLMILAATHAALALHSWWSKKSKYIVLHSAVAIALASFALWVKYPQLSMSFWWILEMTALFGLGIYYKERTYRMMAWLLGIFVMAHFVMMDLNSSQVYHVGPWTLAHNILVGSVAAMCYLFIGALVWRPQVREVLLLDEKDFYFFTFPAAGALILVVLLAQESPERWMTFHWTLLGLGLLIMGFVLKHRAFRFSALAVLGLAFSRIIFFDLAGVDNIYRIIVVIFLGAALLGVSLIYSRVKESS